MKCYNIEELLKWKLSDFRNNYHMMPEGKAKDFIIKMLKRYELLED